MSRYPRIGPIRGSFLGLVDARAYAKSRDMVYVRSVCIGDRKRMSKLAFTGGELHCKRRCMRKSSSLFPARYCVLLSASRRHGCSTDPCNIASKQRKARAKHSVVVRKANDRLHRKVDD